MVPAIGRTFGSGVRELDSTQRSLRDHELLVTRAVHNGFVSRDLQDRLGVTQQEVAILQRSSVRLLGGGNVCMDETTLQPGQTFNTETSSNGFKVHLASTLGTVHVTVIYRNFNVPHERQILFNGPFSGIRDFAGGREGYFQLTVKNESASPVLIYVHVAERDTDGVNCNLM